MERKKVKRILVLSAMIFLTFACITLIAAGIYCNAVQFFTPKEAVAGIALSAASPVIFSNIFETIFTDPLLTWIVIISAVIIIIFIIVLVFALALRSKRKKKRAAVQQSSDAEDEFAPEISTYNYEEIAEAPVVAPVILQAESDDNSLRDASNEADAFIAETVDDDTSKTDELLVKYIRDVNECADKYREVNAKLAAYINKRNKLKEKASEIQKRLFKSHSLETINRFSMTLNKIYKLISKYDSEIASGRKKKESVASELKELRRAASAYISISKIALSVVTSIEDEIIYDLTLSKRLESESEYFNSSLEGSVQDKITEKKKEIAELDAERVYWEQSIAEAAGEDVKMDGMIKLLDIEEQTEAAHDELAQLMTEVTDEPQYKSVEEITATVKKEMKSGRGIVTNDQQKIKARKNMW